MKKIALGMVHFEPVEGEGRVEESKSRRGRGQSVK